MHLFTLNSTFLRPTALALAISLGLSGCASIDNQLGSSSGGAACAAGGVAGAVIGAGLAAAMGKSVGGGALAGAAIGCGATMLYQVRVKRLQDVAREEGLAMQVHELQASTPAAKGNAPQVATVGIEAQLQVGEMFPVGSAQLTAEGQRKMRKVAAALAENQKGQKPASARKTLVVGHTDATGSAELNQRLSEQRARAVGQILAEAGIAATDIYYQGAGSSRPLGDNSTEAGRTENRRVEMTEVDSQQLLVERVRSERNNPKYLAQGTRAEPESKSKAPSGVVAKTTAKAKKQPVQPAEPVSTNDGNIALAGDGSIDFGGDPATNSRSVLAQSIKPKSSSFNFISPAYASAPVGSCLADMPRLTGEVKNLATDTPLSTIATNDYLPGMNGRPWGNDINGNVALVGPVSILKDGAKVVQQPFMQFIAQYKTASKKETEKFQGVANTYEGEDKILYRVFAVDQSKAPVSCMDIVFDKRTGSAVAGEMFYPKRGQAYVTPFQPVRR
jgi:outer membrane protein OmpA-like peptidoglycan-associated protein